jgi:hypothetical protein
MQLDKNKKIAILVVLLVVALVIWMPKGKRKPKASAPATSAPQAITAQMAKIKQRQRTKYEDWGRNPFVWPSEEAEAVVQFELSGIVWDEKSPYVLIDGEILHTGDEISGWTIKSIEPNKVVLTDGFTEQVLGLGLE